MTSQHTAQRSPVLDEVLRWALEREPLGVAVLRPAGDDFRLAYTNPALEAFKSSTPMPGRLMSEVLPEAAERLLPPLREVARTGVTWVAHEYGYEIESGQGTTETRYYSFEVARLLLGGETLLVAFVSEVTKEVQARREAASSSRSMHDLLGRISDAVFSTDREWRYTFVSGQFEKLIGRTAEELVGRNMWEAFPDAEPEFRPPYEQALRERRVVSFRQYYEPLDKWFDLRVYPSETGITVFFLDATEAMKAEQRLELERLRLQTLLDTLPVGVFVSDERGGIIYTNEQASAVWGGIMPAASTADYATYRGWFPDGRELDAEDWATARALRGRRVIGELVDIERFDGKRGSIVVSAAPITDPAGHISGTVAVAQDVTGLRAIEKQLKQSRDALATELELAAERTERMSVLRDMAEIGVRSIDPSEIAKRQLDIMRLRLDLASAYIFHVDRDSATLVPLASTGLPLSVFDAYLPVSIDGEAIMAVAFRRRQPIFVASVEQDRQFGEKAREFLLGLGIRSVALFPLLAGTGVVGILTIARSEPHEYTGEEGSFLESVAAEIGLGLRNADLFQAEQTRRERIEALHGVLEVAVSTMELNEAAQRIIDFLADEHGFEYASAWLARRDGLHLVASVNLPPAYGERFSPMPLSSSYDAVKVFNEGRPLVVSDPSSGNISVSDLYDTVGVRLGAYAIVPLRSRGVTVGTLHFGWREPRRFCADDIAFYSSLGNELGVVLENARLYETERHIADRLQEALLSLPDRVSGVEFAEEYRSATEAARVGGDFYDVFPSGSDHVGLVIGDVAGKGIDAAVLTSLVKNTIRAHAAEGVKSPAEVLAVTNDLVHAATPTEAFVTVFFGLLDNRDGRLVYSSAGHTASVHVSREGGIFALRATGPLLGAFADVTFGQRETRMSFDDILFLYTDGLTEARDTDGMYGEARLLALLGEHAGERPRQLARSVIREVSTFAGGRLRDDVAILAIRRMPQIRTGPEQLLFEI